MQCGYKILQYNKFQKHNQFFFQSILLKKYMISRVLTTMKISRSLFQENFAKFLKPSLNLMQVNHASNNNKLSINPYAKGSFILKNSMQIKYSFCSMVNQKLKTEKNPQNNSNEQINLLQLAKRLKNRIKQTYEISQQRINMLIEQEVQKELNLFKKTLRISAQNQQSQIKLIQQKQKIIEKIKENYELIKRIQLHQDNRAMIMTRLQILWNENYENLSIDDLEYLIQDLSTSKQLKNNYLKSMAMIFLAVQIVKKSIHTPRINKNIVCSTKTVLENITYIQACIKGQIEARKNLQKVQNVLNFLSNCIEKKSSKYCFMKVQSQLNYLITEIYKSFQEPNLYNDKSLCLTSNPPRVVFDQPFNQQYDRFIEMAVLILFDKKLHKQTKSGKLEFVRNIFAKLKMHEQGKLQQSYQNQQNSLLLIKNLKKKVHRMDKRVNTIEWIQNYVIENIPK